MSEENEKMTAEQALVKLAELLNFSLKEFKLCDSVRADILSIASNGVCIKCGSVTDRCFCENDE